MADCFYFNQLLHHYICNVYMINTWASDFTQYLYTHKDIKFTYGIHTLTYLMDTPLIEFINVFTTNTVNIQKIAKKKFILFYLRPTEA